MEWEKRLYDIIQETESNLARARGKLKGKCLSKDVHRSFNEHGTVQQSYSCVQPMTMMSTPWDSPLVSQSCRSLPPVSSPPLPAIAGLSLHDHHTSEMGQLLSKIDSQNMVIDRLERLVKSLNQEKDQYRRHISDLQYSVGDISSRLKETKYLNPHLETQVGLMRHEVRSDLQRLQNMIGAAHNSSLHSYGLERSFNDMQHSVHAELEGIRRDLYSMSHRVGRLELDMSSHSVNQRDLHDRLNASLLTSPYPGHSGHSSHYLGSQSVPQVSQLKDLRSTVSELYGKLDSLEGRLAASSLVPSQSPPLWSGLQKIYKPAVLLNNRKCDDDDDDSCDLDQLDLSDLDLSSDENGEEDSNDLSEDLEEIIKSSSRGGLIASGRTTKVTLADLDLSASDDQPSVSSEGADLSDLDLGNLDLSSAEGSVDLGSVYSGSIDLKVDDL